MSIRTTIHSSQRAFATRAVALCLALVCASLLSGCGGFWQPITTTTTTTNTGTGYDMVYAGKSGNDAFVGYQIASGGLTAVTGSPFSIASPPLAMAINPANTYLYVGTASGIYGYSIAAGGGLTTISSGAVLANPGTSEPPAAMDISPDGLYLAVMTATSSATATNSVVYFYPITVATGLLGTPQSVTTDGLGTGSGGYGTGNVHNIKFSPIYTSSQYVLATAYGTGGEATYTYSPANTVPVVATGRCYPPSAYDSDNAVAFNAAGTSMEVVRGGAATTLISYTITASGTGAGEYSCSLSSAATVSTDTNSNGDPTSVAFNNSTTQPYIYVVNSGDNTVAGFNVTTNSNTPVTSFTALSYSGYSPFVSPSLAPYAIAFDNSGTWMLTYSQSGPPDLIQYTVDTTTATAGRLYVTGSVNTTYGIASGTVGSGITMVTTH